MNNDINRVDKQPLNELLRLKVVPNKLKRKYPNNVSGYSHDSFVKIWCDMYRTEKK